MTNFCKRALLQFTEIWTNTQRSLDHGMSNSSLRDFIHGKRKFGFWNDVLTNTRLNTGEVPRTLYRMHTDFPVIHHVKMVIELDKLGEEKEHEFKEQENVFVVFQTLVKKYD
ncbi:hypothetical protein B9Z55_011672 [Caenorhabditis nigoni]|nr:hypothetical protein B9Z55_011672 [Caenorhabditis nigoni]